MPIQTDDAAVTERQSVPADRFARLLRRSRWPVLAAWVIAVMLLYPLAHGLANATKDTDRMRFNGTLKQFIYRLNARAQ